MSSSRSALLLTLLADLEDVYDETPGRGDVSCLAHSLITADRAAAEGADDEMVTVALLHDAFRVLAPATHGPALACALQDRLSPDRAAILRAHSAWQHDLLYGTGERERYRGSTWFGEADRFARWDAASFSGKPLAPLVAYAPLLSRLLD